ncbi:GNAT family N-acetyltransferase [uncultured Roseivirga sp.]|uniref:GNAT family N-acetyltransferase n=1 Tax=uncultured Roseivirga sp. TaxID=543088 RepID=UPI0030DC99CE|tara:strand:+ start:167886 stop:168419 length:534 start_codon:yes stop_codon:yes gene_type:complete
MKTGAAIIRKCEAKDLTQLTQFALKTFKDTFEKDNDPKDFKAYIDKAITEEKLGQEMTHKGSSFYFLELEGQIIGYIKLNLTPFQSDINDPKSLELERAYVDLNYHGLGYGKMLFDFIIEQAKSHQIEYIWLGVWERNAKAIAFYKQLGFYKFSEHPFKLGTAQQKDHLMRYDLPLS